MSEFEGRGEKVSRFIMSRIFDTTVQDQVHTAELVSPEEYDHIASDLKKSWDFKCDRIVGEVNYGHTKHANLKWVRILPHLTQNNWIPLMIRDEYCPNLFEGDKYSHSYSWKDWVEVIDELDRQGVEPPLN